MSKRKKIPK